MERTLTVPVTMTSQDTEADNSIVERYLAGDMTAFDELMIRYERQIYRVCYRFVNNRDDAMSLKRKASPAPIIVQTRPADGTSTDNQQR